MMQWFVYVAVSQVMALSQRQTVVMTVAVGQAVTMFLPKELFFVVGRDPALAGSAAMTMIARHDPPHFGLELYLGGCVEDER